MKQKKRPSVALNKNGFTFLELSIVILIIGLISGAIVVGQNIIRASEIQTITIDAEKYRAAIGNFRYKYLALPGDMKNATDIWGSVDADPDICVVTVVTGSETCNGNGDGRIFEFTAATGGITRHEAFRAWQQLAAAGMVDGVYTGVSSTLPKHERDFTAGVNAPGSKISGALYAVVYDSSVVSISIFPGASGHLIFYGKHAVGGGTYNVPFEPVLTAEEAFNLDTKEDDGAPDTGKIMGTTTMSLAAPNCTYDSDPGVGVINSYNTPNTDIVCPVIIRTGF